MTSSQEPANENIAPASAVAAERSPETASIAPIAASPEGTLQDEINRLSEELTKMRDQWVRAVAETENIRKRAQREQDETSRYAVTGFARDMVSVLENLKRASESIPTGARNGNELLKTLGEGVDMTLQELITIFLKYGINRIDPQGNKFDHNLHQAVVQIERDDVPPGTVVQVVQAGYVIHDRLLQPAMVAVSKAPEGSKKIDTTA